MSPKRDSDNDKYVGQLKIKNLFKKVFSVKKKDKEEDDLVFDAVPDSPRIEQLASDQSPAGNASSAETCKTKQKKQPQDEKHFDDKKPPTEHLNSDEPFFSKKKTNNINEKLNNYGVFNQSNITLYNGTNIHIGDNKTQVVNVHYGKAPQEKKSQMTTEIKALLNCEDKIERSHLMFLANNFKAEWVKIAIFLGLRVEEIKRINKQYNDFDEASFQMLQFYWCDKKGGDMMVGELARKLWNSKIPAAEHAVRELSNNMDNFTL